MSAIGNFYICSDCKKSVPKANQTIHGVRCIKSRPSEGFHNSKEDDNALPFWKCPRCSYHNENMISTLCSICDSDYENETSNSLESTNQELPNSNGWDCQMCTFNNTFLSTACGMCNERNPSHSDRETLLENDMHRDRPYDSKTATSDEIRPTDSVYRETLIGDDTSRDHTYTSNSSRSSDNCRQGTNSASRPLNDPYDNINNGILLGAVGGAGLAFLSGRSLTTGALSGAAYGALGGLLLNSSDMMNRQNDDDLEDNSESFLSSSSNGNTRNMNTESSDSEDANFCMSSRHLFSNLLNETRFFFTDTMSSTSRSIGENDFNMDYHQLLTRFGNGHEQTPASESSIDTIPTSTFSESHKPSSSSDDKYKCFICIEDFKIGEEISTLPCLHRFHSTCVNRWLRQNNTCPVCKNAISS